MQEISHVYIDGRFTPLANALREIFL